jgi:uncharacterized membrane protein YidH (DUF202 family)
MSPPVQDHAADDSGSAGPRTSLAWSRTALAGIVAAVASLRFALACHTNPLTEVLTVGLAGTATALAVSVVSGARRGGSLQRGETGDGKLMLAVSLLIVALAATHLVGAASGC